MKTVREAVGDYLALRRSLGFKLKKHQRFLEEFASFLEQESTSQITSRLALLWATQPQHIQPAEWAARLSVVRGFARYWSATDATTEVPPDGLLPYRPRRAKPYLYSDEQIDQLLETAKNMPAAHTLQPWTYHCLLGLLAVAGLRISEALNLRGGRHRLVGRRSHDPRCQVQKVSTGPSPRFEPEGSLRLRSSPEPSVREPGQRILLSFPPWRTAR